MIQIIPPERLEEVQRALREAAPPPARVVNVENTLHLHEPEVLEFRGLRWNVEPISAPEGLKLMMLAQAVEQAGSGGAHTLHRAFLAAADFMWLLVKRPGPLRRLVWRWTRNPLRRANMVEVGQLLAFFARLQTRSSVRFRFQEDGSPTATIRN